MSTGSQEGVGMLILYRCQLQDAGVNVLEKVVQTPLAARTSPSQPVSAVFSMCARQRRNSTPRIPRASLVLRFATAKDRTELRTTHHGRADGPLTAPFASWIEDRFQRSRFKSRSVGVCVVLFFYIFFSIVLSLRGWSSLGSSLQVASWQMDYRHIYRL